LQQEKRENIRLKNTKEIALYPSSFFSAPLCDLFSLPTSALKPSLLAWLYQLFIKKRALQARTKINRRSIDVLFDLL